MDIPEALIDSAHAAYINEVNSWRIIGPMREVVDVVHGRSIYGERWRAIRDRLFVSIPINNEPLPNEANTLPFLDFTSEHYAIDYLRWQGTKAVVEYIIASIKIGASSSLTPGDVPPLPTGDTPTG